MNLHVITNQLKQQTLGLLFPIRFCFACGKPLYRAADLCPHCAEELASLPRCPVCDQIGVAPGTVCPWCHYYGSSLPRVIALPYQGRLRKQLLALKYQDARYVAGAAGRLLAARVQALDYRANLVLPVPLHRLRQRERGYNQAALIARVTAAELGLPYAREALSRIRNTIPQHELTAAARRENVAGAFAPGRRIESVKDQKVLLVDDIITTGATMWELYRILMEAGAKSVLTAAVAAPLYAGVVQASCNVRVAGCK